jgi:hypothetical protein
MRGWLVCAAPRGCGCSWYVKTAVFSHFYINAIFLPRQARDKHGENSEKDRFLSQVECVFKDDGRIKSVRKTTPAKFVSCPSRACLGKLTSFSSSKRKLSRNEKGPFFCSQVYAKRARGLMAVRLILCVCIRCVLILSVTLDPFL